MLTPRRGVNLFSDRVRRLLGTVPPKQALSVKVGGSEDWWVDGWEIQEINLQALKC